MTQAPKATELVVVPLPSWLLDDSELESLRGVLVDRGAGGCGKCAACNAIEPAIAAVEREQERRANGGTPIVVVVA